MCVYLYILGKVYFWLLSVLESNINLNSKCNNVNLIHWYIKQGRFS